MVTFELFARLAIDLLAGRKDSSLRFTSARLLNDFKHQTRLDSLPAGRSERRLR